MVAEFHGFRQPAEDPAIHQALVAPGLGGRRGHEILPQATEGELGGIPKFVAEMAVTQNPVHVQVDVTALGCVGAQSKPEGVGATLRNPRREVRLLPFLSLLHLAGIQVAVQQLLMEALQGDSVDDIQGVDDVA